MNAVAAHKPYTPEELLSLPDGDLYELVDGRLVEMNMGVKASWIGGRLFRLMDTWCYQHQLGWILPADSSYQCFPDAPNRVRKPDVSFIRRGRLPGEELPEGHCRIPPDLAAEIVSPKDTYYEVEEKVREYLHAGVRLVWVVNPATRMVRVHRPDGSLADLREHEELTGEDVLPGFRCPVRDLFPPAKTSASANGAADQGTPPSP
jgi:Uma2 family endonuclease